MFEPAASVSKFLKVGVWGDMKSGKTELILSAPDPAVIDSEKGSLLSADRRKFHVKEVTRWMGLAEPLTWLRANPGKFGTLGIDSITPLYQDLIHEVSVQERSRWGKDIITNAGWGVIKRRFKAFLRILVELPLHVFVSARAKDEYEDRVNPKTGQEDSKKTGDLIADIDRNLFYEMDFIVRCDCTVSAVKLAKKGTTEATPKYTVTILGGRRKELPRGKVFDVTDQNAFDVVFADLAKKLSTGKIVAPVTPLSELTDELQKGTTAPPVTPSPVAGTHAPVLPTATAEEHVAEINNFADRLGHRQMGEPCKVEDLKVLYTRAGQVHWPDGTKLSSDDAKAIVKMAFGVSSAKELDKAAVDFLYDEFGKVLAGRARLERDADGTVIIAPLDQVEVS